jgi:hypothetical protein
MELVRELPLGFVSLKTGLLEDQDAWVDWRVRQKHALRLLEIGGLRIPHPALEQIVEHSAFVGVIATLVKPPVPKLTQNDVVRRLPAGIGVR